jgi:hypothetical protein
MPRTPKKKGAFAKLVEFGGKVVNEVEERVLKAVERVKEHGIKSHGHPKYSFRKAADDFGVSHQTVTARFHGRPSHREAAVALQRLPPAQERVIKKHMDEMALRGTGMTPAEVKELASEISGRDCGDRWLAGFRERNPGIVGRFARPLEAPRAQALNPTNTLAFFAMLRDLIETYNIPWHLIYNMDEKGVMFGKGKTKTYVLVDRNIKSVSNIEDGNRENVTIIECVCADGSALHPSVIFKGKKRDHEWSRINPCRARCAMPTCESLHLANLLLVSRHHRRAGQIKNSDLNG